MRRRKQLPKPVSATNKKRGPEPSAMRKLAEAAGLSRGQMYRALAVASIPADDFEAAVESDAPPTVTGLVRYARERRGHKAPRTQERRLRRCPHCGGDLTSDPTVLVALRELEGAP